MPALFQGVRVPVERWGKYWVIYYIVFLAVLAFLLSRHWGALNWDNESHIFLLAAIFGLSAGVALTFTICTELGGRMVLLIPEAVRKLKDAGRQEERRAWVAWNERRQAAERAGLPFDEPPPAGPHSKNGQ